MLRNSAAFLLALATLAGCANPYRIDAPASQPKILNELKGGDHVQVAARNGSVYAIEITDIQRDALLGYDKRANKNWKIPYREIERIDYKRLTTATKVGAISGGIVVGAYTTLLVIVAIFIATW